MSEEKSSFGEEIRVAGKELVDKVRELIAQGNIRKIIVRNEQGKKLLEIPLTGSVVVGGVLAVFAPMLLAIGALAGFAAKLRVQIIRTDDPADPEGEE